MERMTSLLNGAGEREGGREGGNQFYFKGYF